MQRITSLFPQKKVAFLICSNTKVNAESFPGMSVIKGTNHELEDLYAFSKCDYLAGPPSTYTMWASFYGDVPLYQMHDPNSAFSIEDFKIIITQIPDLNNALFQVQKPHFCIKTIKTLKITPQFAHSIDCCIFALPNLKNK